ncbi:cellulose binding domain-containing protein [Modicisalibacter luteus]|uniref:Cellulose binding domain-containing protein n=2 Tax=Modicisalibacter luteus TaxID=453962 RepID=A0ABV7M3B5_9GAMM|nr:cellulose binding domain-containing protein [Halomonas lutea]GHA86188.1 hypothetical protein GCM10007159_04190 [Halomonas lutea]
MRPSIVYKTTSQWNGGYVMEVFITNEGAETIPDYEIGFSLPGDITDVWGGVIAAQEGNSYVISDDDNKNDIAAGETVRFKFKVLTEAGELPSSFNVNGVEATVNGIEPSGSSAPDEKTEALAPSLQASASTPSETHETAASLITVGPDITAAQLESLIARAPEGATVQLAAGEYRFDDSISITRSDIALVGAGSAETRITFTDKSLANDDSHAFYVEGTNTTFAGRLRNDATEHSDTLTLANDHGLQAGDTVRIWQDNSQAYYDEIGDSSWQKDNAPLRTSMAKVISVDGETITLDRGVHFDFDGGDAKIERMDTRENVTLQGFSIQYELGTPDKAVFSNTLSDLTDYQAVKFDGTVNGRVNDVQVSNGPSTAFEFALSLDLRADGLQAHGAFNKGSGGNGYSYEFRESYDGTFINLEDSGMRHSAIFASWRSSVGNDIRVKSTDRDINFHGGQDHDNTVHVDQSIREADADGMSTTFWYNNGGESFGAITEAGANKATFEYVIGSRRDDVLQGSDDGVYLDGALGSDTLNGGTGSDILSGGGGWGDNVLNGGAGDDTALFDQAFDAYKIRFNDNGSVYVDGSSDDTLIDIEKAVFADGTVLDIATRQTSQGEKPVIPTAGEIILDEIEASPVTHQTNPERSNEVTAPTTEAFAEPLAAPAPSDAGPGIATVALETVSSWSNGYVMRVVITNTSSAPIDKPQITFNLAADVDTLYGATLLERDGDTYTVAYDGSDTVEPGESLRFSFKAYAPEDVKPEVLAINGDELAADAAGTEEPQQSPSEEELSAPTTETSANPVAAPSPNDAETGIATVALETVSSWSNGYVMRVVITNTSSAPIDNPNITFNLTADVDTLYGATLLERDGDTYTVAYDGSDTVEPGESLRFSFKAYAPEDMKPEVLAINGDELATHATDAEGPEVSQVQDMLSVSSNITSEWSTGYVTEVFIENTSDSAVSLPAVSFELPADIVKLWNGQVEKHGEQYSVSAMNGGQELEPGEVWRFSFKARGEDHTLPSNIMATAGGESGAVEPAMALEFNLDVSNVIDLSSIDASSHAEGDQAFVWLGDADFSGAAGELTLSGSTLLGDRNGDSVADLTVQVVGIDSLQASELIL